MCSSDLLAYEHRVVAENMMGRKLAVDEVVHHEDENKLNNNPDNLLVCTNAEHQAIHRKLRALQECGNEDYRKCCYCGEYDDPKNMLIYDYTSARHSKCSSEYGSKPKSVKTPEIAPQLAKEGGL